MFWYNFEGVFSLSLSIFNGGIKEILVPVGDSEHWMGWGGGGLGEKIHKAKRTHKPGVLNLISWRAKGSSKIYAQESNEN